MYTINISFHKEQLITSLVYTIDITSKDNSEPVNRNDYIYRASFDYKTFPLTVKNVLDLINETSYRLFIHAISNDTFKEKSYKEIKKKKDLDGFNLYNTITSIGKCCDIGSISDILGKYKDFKDYVNNKHTSYIRSLSFSFNNKSIKDALDSFVSLENL